jgi:hypothetical protein
MRRSWLENVFEALGLLVLYRIINPLSAPPEHVGPTDPQFWKSPARRFAVVLAVVFALGGVLLLTRLIFVGPRMNSQPNIRPFQARMPLSPKGSVPVVDVIPPVPTTQQAAQLKNPLKSTPATLAAGKVYYEYYCLFCHGDTGQGDGPVGVSYTPPPANLRTAKLRTYTDGQLLRAILTGPGHEPVLNYTIIEPHRWPLVLYTRQLNHPLSR